jgi:hypothetical protein
MAVDGFVRVQKQIPFGDDKQRSGTHKGNDECKGERRTER